MSGKSRQTEQRSFDEATAGLQKINQVEHFAPLTSHVVRENYWLGTNPTDKDTECPRKNSDL